MSEKKIAQYKQIENDLLEKINLGYYKKGDLIPTELELAATYQVSRVTVRKACLLYTSPSPRDTR